MADGMLKTILEALDKALGEQDARTEGVASDMMDRIGTGVSNKDPELAEALKGLPIFFKRMGMMDKDGEVPSGSTMQGFRQVVLTIGVLGGTSKGVIEDVKKDASLIRTWAKSNKEIGYTTKTQKVQWEERVAKASKQPITLLGFWVDFRKEVATVSRLASEKRKADKATEEAKVKAAKAEHPALHNARLMEEHSKSLLANALSDLSDKDKATVEGRISRTASNAATAAISLGK